MKVTLEYNDEEMDNALDAMRVLDYKLALYDITNALRGKRKHCEPPECDQAAWAEELVWGIIKERELAGFI